jgi:hypothetical protein
MGKRTKKDQPSKEEKKTTEEVPRSPSSLWERDTKSPNR